MHVNSIFPTSSADEQIRKMMISTSTSNEEQTAAKLLWQLKAIATKEVESVNIPYSCIDSFFIESMGSSEGRGRTVSVDETMDIAIKTITPVLSGIPKTLTERNQFLLDSTREKSVDHIDHHDWSPQTEKKFPHLSLIGVEEGTRQSKRKRESHVGLTTKSGIIRSTLRKKFSWKQYPELEDYLLKNQEEYFEYSSRNYTAEQRKYNNGLTRGLLDLASEEGYVFEEFTFSMVRDRIRCYYKSHSQSAKKKRRR